MAVPLESTKSERTSARASSDSNVCMMMLTKGADNDFAFGELEGKVFLGIKILDEEVKVFPQGIHK